MSDGFSGLIVNHPAASVGGRFQWLHSISLIGVRTRATGDKVSFVPAKGCDFQALGRLRAQPAGRWKESCHRLALFGHLSVKYDAHCGNHDLN